MIKTLSPFGCTYFHPTNDITTSLFPDVYEARSAGSTSTTNPRIKSSVVHPPLVLALQPVERRLARLFRTQLESIGRAESEAGSFPGRVVWD